mmetsp:Transcript_30050/g.34571  ORF Transcript_30050/g.34571 Transcript_30050/m.34571 type:complete len:173 (+) Transcript_30050:1-519(+)
MSLEILENNPMTVECERLKVSTFIVMGSCYRKDLDYDNCAKYYKFADDLERMVFGDDEKGLCIILINRGIVAYETYDYEEARDFFNLALEIQKRTASDDNRLAVAEVRTQIGKTCSKQRDYQNALRYFQFAYTAKKKAGNERLVASSLGIIVLRNAVNTTKIHLFHEAWLPE